MRARHRHQVQTNPRYGIPDGVRQTDGGLVCEASTEEAAGTLRPVDIVWAIDSSPSMDDEIAIIQANLNAFTNELAQSGLDYRVILISADRDISGNGMDFTGVCIPPSQWRPWVPGYRLRTLPTHSDPIHSRDRDGDTKRHRSLAAIPQPDARLSDRRHR